MKQFVVMLGISLLLASGFLPLHAEARGATSRLVEVRDQDLVRDVQRQLKAQGFYPGAVDGNFGSQTATALRAYQRSYRLPATGRLDETTLRSLLPERSEVSGAPEVSRAPVDLSNREVLRDAQRQLKALGFNPGSTDGTLGPQTEAALRAYQHAYRLPETGKLDETTGRSLLRERFETSRAPVDLSNREVLRDAQRQLKALGFDPGSTDGTFGPQTEAALRAYQQSYRLPETGRLDDVTLRSLLPERRQGALR
jgi:peptidoglycan hydrolase-like protein with peptidoglycan-binding domain